MDVHIHQRYMQFLSGQDAGSGPAPFFQPTPPPPPPPKAPMMAVCQWAVALPPQPMRRDASGLAPGEGSLTAAGDAFLGDEQLVDGLELEEDTLALMRMTGDELSAFLSDGPGVDPLCVPPDRLMGSLNQAAMADSPSVPPAGGVSQSSSGSPGLGCAQARATDSPASCVDELLMRMSQSSSGSPGLGAQVRATDSPASGVEELLMRMSHSSSGSPGLGYAQARATDSPVSGVVEPLTRMSGDGQSAFLSDGAAGNSLCVPPECLMNSLLAYHPAMDDSPPVPPADGPTQSSSGSPGLGCAQARATDSPVEGAYPPAPPAASLDGTQQVPDGETAEVARMVQVAVRCGDRPSTAWSVEEDQLLRQDLSRFAGQDTVIQCFRIASLLLEKTALDVAYRIRWLTDLEKKKAAKELQLGQEKSAGGNVTKGKGTKVTNKKNNKHPLSKEALDSRSAKDIIRDNNRLMDKIEEILRTGEVNNCPDYFYYVKMNMDAMQNKVKDLGSVMEGLSVGDEEWEDVLKDRRDAPQAGDDAATPAP